MATNPAQELSTIDFASMLGGPLMAVVNAQAQSAMASVNFIKQVGFKKSTTAQGPDGTSVDEPVYVTFKYPKMLAPYQPAQIEKKDEKGNVIQSAAPATPAVFEVQQLTVPILTMLPIPFIRIEETTIDFNAKINSVETARTDESIGVDATLEAKAGFAWASAKLKVSASYKKSTETSSNVERTYSMAVHIKAVQDEMPAGMEKLLGILENAITSQPASAPAPTKQ
jgi:hypothetical protein